MNSDHFENVKTDSESRRQVFQAGLRSVSEGGKKYEKIRNTTRESSGGGGGGGGSSHSLDVRCGCQYFQCDLLLPEKSAMMKNSRPNSRLSQNTSLKTNLYTFNENNNINDGHGITDETILSSALMDDDAITITTSSSIANHHNNVLYSANKNFSKINGYLTNNLRDHEYEPVNPPPEDAVPLKSHVSEVLNPNIGIVHSSQQVVDSPPTNDITQIDLSKQDNNETIKKEVAAAPDARAASVGGKFQIALKESAAKFKTKLNRIKKPNITLPARPKFQKPNIKKPNLNITLPKFSDLTSTFRKTDKEDNEKSSKSKEPESSQSGVFDFSTYPRIFKKKKMKEYDSGSLKQKEQITTELEYWKDVDVKSSKKDSNIVRIPLHSEASMDLDNDNNIVTALSEPQNEDDDNIKEESSLPTPLYQQRNRHFEEDLDLNLDIDQGEREIGDENLIFGGEQNNNNWTDNDDEHFYYNQENTEVTDLDQPEEPIVPVRHRMKLQRQQNDGSVDTNGDGGGKEGSSMSSLRSSRRGVLEEIDSDHFFLREKGISQDNIEVGRYLSTEIREAFRTSPPQNALADTRQYNHEEEEEELVRIMTASNRSLPETVKKKIGVKKPKRTKRTPHASQERFRYEREESEENEGYNFMPPIRPKRRSRKKKKEEDRVKNENIELYLDEGIEIYPNFQEFTRHPPLSAHECEEDNLLRINYHKYPEQASNLRRASEPATPAAPTRKHKSLKSLNVSERGSIIFDDYDDKQNQIKVSETDYNMNKYVNEESSWSATDIIPLEQKKEEEEEQFPPKAPTRSRSKTRSMSRTTSRADSTFIERNDDSAMLQVEDNDDFNKTPVVEEACVKDLRDAMGYAIVDKNQNKNWEHKFCTVPRRTRGSAGEVPDAPERPVRNYSTLGPSRPPRKPTIRNMTDEEKENVDIMQYIEIDEKDEGEKEDGTQIEERDLQSGEVIQKVQNRPLPAPPRPERRAKARTPLNDVTAKSDSHINVENNEHEDVGRRTSEEIEASTQTEPLPSDFVCEEMIREESDKIMTPSLMRKNDIETKKFTENSATIERVLITPTKYSYQEETITRGQLLVEPLNGAKILPDSDLTKPEIIVPIIVSDKVEDEDYNITSEIPEHFDKLADPEIKAKEISGEEKSEKSKSKTIEQEEEVLKKKKLQIADLDVERLTVNELVANKIVVSEIESGNLISQDINTKTGTIKLSDIELEPMAVEKLLKQLQESSNKEQQQRRSILNEENGDIGQKKNSDEMSRP